MRGAVPLWGQSAEDPFDLVRKTAGSWKVVAEVPYGEAMAAQSLREQATRLSGAVQVFKLSGAQMSNEPSDLLTAPFKR